MSVPERSLLRVLTHTPGTMIGVAFLAFHLLVVVFAPWLAPHGATELVGAPLQAPGAAGHFLGTDLLGRDYLSRLMLGGRTSLTVAMLGALAAVVIGGVVAVSAAYVGGLYDDVVMRIVDTKLSIPGILFVAIFVVGFGRSLPVLTLVIGLTYMPGAIRIIRAQALTIVPLGYVRAAQLRGESTLRIVVGELLPNVMEVVVVEFAIRTSSAVLAVSALSFLGLGISPPTPDWGLMIAEGVAQIYAAPWLVALPAAFISTLVIGLNFASDGLASALGLDAARGLEKA